MDNRILPYANLQGADLRGAYLRGAKGLGAFVICPQGTIIGWKKLQGGIIAKLEISVGTLRVNALGSRKCRAASARVVELYGAEEATDQHTGTLLYRAGEMVYPDSFDPDVRVECSHGIHFFITREEAEEYEGKPTTAG